MRIKHKVNKIEATALERQTTLTGPEVYALVKEEI